MPVVGIIEKYFQYQRENVDLSLVIRANFKKRSKSFTSPARFNVSKLSTINTEFDKGSSKFLIKQRLRDELDLWPSIYDARNKMQA